MSDKYDQTKFDNLLESITTVVYEYNDGLLTNHEVTNKITDLAAKLELMREK